jgi:hypothetical protein
LNRHPLAGVQAKLERASEHLNALGEETNAFFNGHPYEVRGEFEPDSSSYVFRLEVIEEPPARLGAILGDFAHNCRSALDHVVWQLVLRDGGTPGRHNQFPIFDTEAQFIEQVVCARRGPLTGVDPHSDEWALIEGQQPYHVASGEPFLPVLAWLSNEDKHRIVHPVLGFTRGPKTKPTIVGNEDAGELAQVTMGVTRRLEDGAEIARVQLQPRGPNPQVQMQATVACAITFGERLLKSDVLPPLHEYVVTLAAHLARGFS